MKSVFVGSPDYIVICIRGQSGNRQSEMTTFTLDFGQTDHSRILGAFFLGGKLFDFENSGKLEEEFGLWPWGMWNKTYSFWKPTWNLKNGGLQDDFAFQEDDCQVNHVSLRGLRQCKSTTSE